MIDKILCALALSAMIALPAAAEGPQPFADFSAKRVKPPAAGSAKRITVQIAPRANPAVPPLPARPAAPAAAAPALAAGGGGGAATPGPRSHYGWFWTTVSAALEDSGPGRLEPALSMLGKGPSGARVAAPRLQALQDIAARHGKDILRETVGTQVSPAFALAVIAVESAGRSDAVSGAGAQGLMQLMPDTAARFGVSDSLDPVQNIRGGVAFLDFLMRKFDGDPILVLAGYNAGENSIGQHGGVPPYAETRDYVPKVLAAFEVAMGLCLTRPMLVSDGCVFQVAAR
jgi:soluble lytic murein transglycosylase-like protein